jgi:type VI secretion system protein ImpF
MAITRTYGAVTLSVLDRLIDDDLLLDEKQLTRSESVRKLRDAVRRDLEWLLNSRQPVDPAPEGSQLEDSVFMYGLPDFSAMTVKSSVDRQRLCKSIQAAVCRFEPRLSNIRVNLVASNEDLMPRLRFVIEGQLRLDPNPEQVSFDTVLELSSGEYKVRGEASAR